LVSYAQEACKMSNGVQQILVNCAGILGCYREAEVDIASIVYRVIDKTITAPDKIARLQEVLQQLLLEQSAKTQDKFYRPLLKAMVSKLNQKFAQQALAVAATTVTMEDTPATAPPTTTSRKSKKKKAPLISESERLSQDIKVLTDSLKQLSTSCSIGDIVTMTNVLCVEFYSDKPYLYMICKAADACPETLGMEESEVLFTMVLKLFDYNPATFVNCLCAYDDTTKQSGLGHLCAAAKHGRAPYVERLLIHLITFASSALDNIWLKFSESNEVLKTTGKWFLELDGNAILLFDIIKTLYRPHINSADSSQLIPIKYLFYVKLIMDAIIGEQFLYKIAHLNHGILEEFSDRFKLIEHAMSTQTQISRTIIKETNKNFEITIPMNEESLLRVMLGGYTAHVEKYFIFHAFNGLHIFGIIKERLDGWLNILDKNPKLFPKELKIIAGAALMSLDKKRFAYPQLEEIFEEFIFLYEMGFITAINQVIQHINNHGEEYFTSEIFNRAEKIYFKNMFACMDELIKANLAASPEKYPLLSSASKTTGSATLLFSTPSAVSTKLVEKVSTVSAIPLPTETEHSTSLRP